jgi:hypothetical protein
MTIENFISNALSLDAQKLIIEAASQNLPELADLNTIQLSKGFLSDGKRTDTYTNPDYAKYKKSIGSKSVPYADLKLTSEFHEGFYAKVQGDNLQIGSTDSKEAKLQQQFTPEIFGVNTVEFCEQIDTDLSLIIDKKLMK